MAFESSNWTPPPDDVVRALPHAVGPEKSLLSSMLQDPREFLGIAIEEKLSEEHFYIPGHGLLFGMLIELFESGEEIELVSLVQRLLDRGLLNRVGGPSAVADLYTYAPSSGHFRQHLQHVKDKHVLRSIIQAGNNMIASAYDSPGDAAGVLDEAESSLTRIRDFADRTKTPGKRELIDRVLDELQSSIRQDADAAAGGITTGFADLDRMAKKLRPGNMIVVAARPSMGKTSFMMNIVEHVCLDLAKPTMVFSLEMPSEDLMRRLIYGRARYHDRTSRGERPTKGDLLRIQRASADVQASPLTIDDTSGLSINELRAKARRQKRDNGLDFIAIDYLQLMKSRSKQAEGSREREIAEISAGIKGLAKELEVPILILAQLNRGPESRSGKSLGVPRMSDLRESGAIEQDADMVGLLYRTAYYAQDEASKAAEEGRARLLLAKNRNGETGSVDLTFVAELMRFENGSPAAATPTPSSGARWED